jgi:hypothetical protein
MKRRFEPVEVEVTRGWPVVVRWNGKTHRVQHLVDTWVVQGRWWAEEERRVCFRVTTSGGMLDIYRSGDAWVLARAQD